MNPSYKAIAFVLLNQVPFTALRLALPLYALSLGASPAMVGAVVALFSLPSVLASVHLGRLLDRKGMRVPLLGAGATLAVGLLLAASWESAYALLLVAALSGGAYNAILIAGQQLVGRYSLHSDRVTAYARLSTCFAVSLALVPMATGFLIDQAGFRFTFLLMAALSPLSLLMVVFNCLPHLGAPEFHQDGAPSSREGLASLLKTPGLLELYAFGILFTASWDLFLFTTPLYGSQLRLSASQIGVIVGSFSVAMLIVRLFANTIANFFSHRRLIILCLLVIGFGCIGFGTADTMTLLVAFALVMGLGQGLANPTLNAVLYETSPPQRVAEAMGLRMSIGKSCQVVLPLIAGGAAATFNAGFVFLFLAALQIGAATALRKPGKAYSRPNESSIASSKTRS